MLKFCLEQWDKNKDILEKHIRESKHMCNATYLDLVKMIVEDIFNNGDNTYLKYNANKITEIDDGDYQGTLLFIIPADVYQPGPGDYLIANVYYGSCSGCDTLQSINFDMRDDCEPSEEQVKDFMALCKDIVMSILRPYNIGWLHEDKFDTVEVTDDV